MIGLPNKAWIPNKTEDLNLSVFDMITGINKLKTLTKHISYDCKCRFDGKKIKVLINCGITTNVDVGVKTFMYVKKIMFGIILHVFVKIENI